MFSSKDLFFTPAAGGYTVSKSLRFRASATAYLNRTFSTPTNVDKWTFSAWIKRTLPGTNNTIFSANTNFYQITYDSSTDTIQVGTSSNYTVTNAKFRDPSAWGHVIVTFDSSLAATSRCKIYFNGSEASYSSQGFQTNNVINSAIAHYIGRQGVNTNYLDGYLAEVNFIDGSALTPSSFGAYDTNGIWQPAAYTGSYGNNGFYLKFTDVGATSGANSGYGKDFSTNTNYWTTNNFNSTSTSASYDSMLDSPTNATGDIGNYCTYNPINGAAANHTVTNGNLTVSGTSAVNVEEALGSFSLGSGKWYWEFTITAIGAGGWVGISTDNGIWRVAGNAVSYGYFYVNTGNKRINGTETAYGSTFTTGTVIAVALDMDNGALYFGQISGGVTTWQNSGVPTSGSSKTGAISVAAGSYFPCSALYGTSSVTNTNFGQQPLSGTVPSGYSAVNTQNLTTPTITNGASYMAAVTYTGTGSSQTITASSTNSGNNPNGTTFQPDLVWVKGRSGATDHAWYDAVRGVQLQIESNTTTAETTETTGLTAFTSSGFTTGALAQMNTNTATYVAWEWNAGGSTVTNTTGSISAQVRANTSAGFSVVTFTQLSAAPYVGTVGHGLNAIPSMVIIKDRSAANGWLVYHSSIGATQYLVLNTTAAAVTGSNAFNNTGPTSSVFTTAAGSTYWGNAGATAVAYCFAPVAGYSAFGSYTGNGSTDGPFVYTGFRPRFVMIKGTATATSWLMVDSARNNNNVVDNHLGANLAEIENGASLGNNTNQLIDFLSNGFKIRMTNSDMNNSGANYIYMAVAENPFKISRAR